MENDPFINYAKANQPKPSKPRQARINKKPEKEVEKSVMGWLAWHGFSVHVIEAKAVFSQALGRYMRGQVCPGISDLVGCTPDGMGCFIELKAIGRISTLSNIQWKFLKNKIDKGSFACVVDSSNLLEQIYKAWKSIDNLDEKKLYLLKHLGEEK